MRKLKSQMKSDRIGLKLQVSLFRTKAVNLLWNNFLKILILTQVPRVNSRLLTSITKTLLSREIHLLDQVPKRLLLRKRAIITVRITLKTSRPNLIPLKRPLCQSHFLSKLQSLCPSQCLSLSNRSLQEPLLLVRNLKDFPNQICLRRKRNELQFLL